MHEFTLSASRQKAEGASALDIAKGLIDRGFHPPTIYFPLIVKEAMMIEPTESETRETLDEFVSAMIKLAEICQQDPASLHRAPELAPVGRPDEAAAARHPILTYKPDGSR
jgi:glycine dehydrogenase subunit 2